MKALFSGLSRIPCQEAPNWENAWSGPVFSSKWTTRLCHESTAAYECFSATGAPK